MKKTIKIGIFASSHSLAEQIRQSSTLKNESLIIREESLSNAIPLALEMEKNKIEVIISRRGTAHLLREKLKIPIISFPNRPLNILTSLHQASTHGKKILLPAFRHKLEEIQILEKLLQVEIIHEVYENSTSLEQVIRNGNMDGCNVVLGGMFTQKIAATLHMNYVEIKTSTDDIISTIENAKSVIQASRKEKEKALQYRSIINASSDGIIAVDENGRITILNTVAANILNMVKQEAIGKPLSQFFPQIHLHRVLRAKEPLHDQLIQIQNRSFMFNLQPIILDKEIIGGALTIRDISRVIRSESIVRKSLAKGFVAKYDLTDLIHKSQAMKSVVEMCKQYAKIDSTILIMGETGTGKEILVHGIHKRSPRADKPFVSVNCAALPEQLLESELFGHEEGSFTGSKKGGKPGLFELAHQGTLFLDEIDSTPINVQILLLRVLQEKEVRRVGGERSIPVNVRIIAAIGKDLSLAIHQGDFREDLFFRLNVLRITIPPLRQRKEDIPVILKHFIKYYSAVNEMPSVTLPEYCFKQLIEYGWPGNVRQLQNFSESIVMNCNLKSSHNTFEYLYQELIEYTRVKQSYTPQEQIEPTVPKSFQVQIKQHTQESEETLIRQALLGSHYNKTKTAKILGISRSTLWRKMKEFNLN